MILHLRELLKERGLSSVAFAEMLGVHKTTVSYWLNGKVFPGEETLTRIAKTLGVPVCRLFAEGGECCPEKCVNDDYRRRFLASVATLRSMIDEWVIDESAKL